MKEWDDARDQEEEAADEDDPEKPNLEEMMNKQKENIQAQREADEAFLGEFAEALKEKGVPVIEDINTDTSANFVFVKLNDKIKAHFQMRPDLLERQQAQKLTVKELPTYEERSYTYKQSKFGVNCPIYPTNPIKTKNHAVLYRERIYYLSDGESQDKFLMEPSKYTKGVEPIPLDIQIVPKVAVIGLPKSGKSILCQ
jgi:adenylate/nucleoside-diphosphate kinase